MMTDKRMFQVEPQISSEPVYGSLNAWHTVVKLGLYGITVSTATIYKIKKGDSREFKSKGINPFTVKVKCTY